MNRTTIEWVKNPDGTQGYTWNPITGCLNHINGLCKGGGFPCYAYKLAHGRLKEKYLNHQVFPVGIFDDEFYRAKPANDPFYPRFWVERLQELESRASNNNLHHEPIGVFVCDMSDLFGNGVPEEWTRRVLGVIGKQMIYPALDDRFYLLTKQPQNLIKWSPFPENCWVGVTITNEDTLLKATTNLGYFDARVKFISFEPLLERIPLPYYQMNADWLIIGACTGTAKEVSRLFDKYPRLTVMRWGNRWTLQPRIEDLREIVEAADKAGIKVFLKDNLDPLLRTIDGQIPTGLIDGQIPTGLCDNYGHTLRQELPGL